LHSTESKQGDYAQRIPLAQNEALSSRLTRVWGCEPTIWDPEAERLEEAECWRLISAGGVGRLAYSGRFGLAVFPVGYQVDEGSLVFRIALGSPTDEDLRTGIEHAEYSVAFEIDEIDFAAREGWSVLIHGSAHHVDSETERAAVVAVGVEPWAGGVRDLFLRITPARITGRRIRRE
jgi:nitroimidazol reductase NimA-like FMN-containing flavoprotein (pyridoxamine 5'-phosphate oxidase superfamily)